MKDYYEILGVEEDASQEEIRERWLELSKLYHPDVLKSPEADERIKEINEAYQVLKDYSSRLEYDLQRALQKSLLKKFTETEKKKFPWPKVFISTSISVAAALTFFLIFFKSSPPSDKQVKFPIPEAAKGREIVHPQKPEMIAKVISSPVSTHPGTSTVVPEDVPQKPEPSAQPKSMAKILPKEGGQLLQPEKKLEPPKIEPVKKAERKPELAKALVDEKREAEKPKITGPNNTQEKAKVISHERPKINEIKEMDLPIKPEEPAEVEKPKEKEKPPSVEVAAVAPSQMIQAPEPKKFEKTQILMEKPQEVTKTPAPEIPKAEPPQVAHILEPKKEQKPEIVERPKEPEKPPEIVREIKPEPAKVIAPEAAKIIEAKKPEKIEAPEKTTSRGAEEIKKFLDGYIAKYNQKDINGFLSFFSDRAIQNQKYTFADLKKIYAKFFDQSLELTYQLKEVQTFEHPQGWEVKAKYELSQVAKKDGAKKSWRGQIRWVLVKENDQLKIISLDYQHQQ